MTAEPPSIEIAGLQLKLQKVRLRSDLLLDEVTLEGENLKACAPAQKGEAGTIDAGETRFRALISEPNLNTLMQANVPPGAPVKNLNFQLLTGAVRISGQIARGLLHLPFSIDAALKVENGTKIEIDLRSASAGFAMPEFVLNMLEQFIKHNSKIPTDLAPIFATLPVPVRLDEIHCEPGRLYITGRAVIQMPPPAKSAEKPVVLLAEKQ